VLTLWTVIGQQLLKNLFSEYNFRVALVQNCFVKNEAYSWLLPFADISQSCLIFVVVMHIRDRVESCEQYLSEVLYINIGESL